jgi:hypothetical protein
MFKIHVKSPCCHVPVWHHGVRRRYCPGCGRTWTIRKKRRGRKQKRRNGAALIRYFRGGARTTSLYTLRQELRFFLEHAPWPALPRGRLLVVADAFYARVEKRRLSVYLTLVRPLGSRVATILAPTIGEGAESYAGWRAHFETLPPSVLRRLTAAVCDGRTGLVALVRERRLVLQRCHFHLLARIQMKRSKLLTSQHYEEGVRLYRLATTVLTALEPAAHMARRQIAAEARRAPRGLRTVLSGFATHYADYRAYRTYPALELPTTTGAAESLIGSIRGLLRRLRGVRTRHALERWLWAYVKHRRTIRCNSQQN